MSYDLAVWYPDQFLSDEQALRRYIELCHGNISELKPHPSIDEFYFKLTSIHPEIEDVPEDKIDDFDFSPWSIAHDRSDRHIIMCCVWSHADYVHDFVLDLALKHGLAVFDPQLTKIHYPRNKKSLKTSDFDYHLPESSIAQTPLEPRDSSRLLVLDRTTGKLEHKVFRDIGHYLNPGDLLVLNQTRVIPARLAAKKSTGGKVEILLLRRVDALTWECLVGGKGMTRGKRVTLEDGLGVEIVEAFEGSRRLVRFDEPVEAHLPKDGVMPLPPYIHEKLRDPERYQTVYAHDPGSAAAPTAGLHFTPRLLDELQAKGVQIAYVTLHVGLDTFAPVTEDDPTEHVIHTEWCELPQETADAINATRTHGGRIIAVGTTSVRTLESAAPTTTDGGQQTVVDHLQSTVCAYSSDTSIFILPGYQFKVVDALITNFHLPKSTLIMLVSAFAGREKTLETYATAIKKGYRFFSFGDAMLIS